ncbi:MAG: glycosyltransferase family 9 protein, partial [bacterium]
MRAPKNILVIRPGAMGDILVATPVLPNLRRAFPRSRIAFLVDKKFADVLKANPYVDEVIKFDRAGMGSFWGLRRMKRELAFLAFMRAKRFDLVFDLLGNLRSAILCAATGARERVGYTYRVRKFFYNRRVLARNPQYVVDFNLESLRMVGVPVGNRDIHLPADESDKSFAGGWLSMREIDRKRLLIGLFPGGGWPSKRWPEEYFAQLGDMFSS